MTPEHLAHLRHELRTPLNHIIGYGEMLLEDTEGGPQAGYAPLLRGILIDARSLVEQVNRFLAPSNIEAGAVDGEHLPVALTEPLDHIVAAAKSIHTLAIEADNTALLPDVLRLNVAAEHLRELLRSGMMQGLPAHAPHSTGVAAVVSVPVHPGSTRDGMGAALGSILVVDDNENNREMLSRRLLREGYKDVRLAVNGRQALEMLNAQKFDLVLLDIMMPEIDGYQVLETLKAHPTLRDIPVIMISALDEMESVIRCIELGAEDYLPKPFDATLLRARVGASLEKKALRDEVHAWNKKLEVRVQEQVAQLDRLGRLKGFFSPQLAESIVNGGGEDLLKTHRREVVVVFLDLRGFTAFTDRSEPEEVMGVLGEYHRVMGQLVVAHEGTLERFAGDGLMIFFNDPIQLEHPTLNAVKMSLDMQAQFAPLRTAWKKRGFDLDLGIGIAQGYATLGAIGFEGRWDYACIGSVTNLAARLCGEAKGGQVLTNQKTLSCIEDDVLVESLGDATMKGISQPVAVFNVTGFKG